MFTTDNNLKSLIDLKVLYYEKTGPPWAYQLPE